MLGNVYEWTRDWAYRRYNRSAQNDPVGPEEGVGRVIRGGSWAGFARSCRAASRRAFAPSDRLGSLGFRFVRGQAAPGGPEGQ